MSDKDACARFREQSRVDVSHQVRFRCRIECRCLRTVVSTSTRSGAKKD